MNSSFDAGLAAAARLAAAEREREERDPRHGELWALAVTELVVQRLPPLPALASGESAAATAPPRNPGHAEAMPASAAPVTAAAANAGGAAPGAGTGALSLLGGAGEDGPAGAAAGGAELPSQLSAVVSDERFGRLQLHVARGAQGLAIVINVADSHVKALIEAEHAMLIKTLKDAGLRVASVQIGNSSQLGTGFAHERGGAERSRAGAAFQRSGARRREYPGSREAEDDETSSEGVDFTA